MTAGDEQKPELEKLDKIDVVVVKDGVSTTLKVRPTTKFDKIFTAIEAKFGVDKGTFKFTFGGERIRADDTPESLGLEHQDQVDAFLEQIGGSS